MPIAIGKPGSVTRGSNRLEDLLPAFVEAIEQLDPAQAFAIKADYPLFFGFDPGDRVDFDDNDYGRERMYQFIRRIIDDEVSFSHVRVFRGSSHPVGDKLTFLLMGALSALVDGDELWRAYEADAQLACDDLVGKLNEYSPAFCNFAPYENDDSDWGWWFQDDLLEEAVADGTAVKVEDGDDWEIVREADPSGNEHWLLRVVEDDDEILKQKPDYVVCVNDHGNVTVFNADGQELYSIV